MIEAAFAAISSSLKRLDSGMEEAAAVREAGADVGRRLHRQGRRHLEVDRVAEPDLQDELAALAELLDGQDREAGGAGRHDGERAHQELAAGVEVLQDAVIRQLEILGEAASRVDQEYRSSNPQIPWSKAISTRNRLIHGYLSVDMEIVFRTATHHVPRLRPSLVQAVGDLDR
mgnify:CR=1 FL=1